MRRRLGRKSELQCFNTYHFGKATYATACIRREEYATDTMRQLLLKLAIPTMAAKLNPSRCTKPFMWEEKGKYPGDVDVLLLCTALHHLCASGAERINMHQQQTQFSTLWVLVAPLPPSLAPEAAASVRLMIITASLKTRHNVIQKANKIKIRLFKGFVFTTKLDIRVQHGPVSGMNRGTVVKEIVGCRMCALLLEKVEGTATHSSQWLRFAIPGQELREAAASTSLQPMPLPAAPIGQEE
ncbi:hypothetical protein UY3_02841 [Chelonia mydas]|uniref:Uncharacterized protein n=1 Tax=Chelonia mydas TaxID=8469 RepID=M7BVR3_CHEMY|nr:hypothetical protein UY3_02841 [Chelonia mydas]